MKMPGVDFFCISSRTIHIYISHISIIRNIQIFFEIAKAVATQNHVIFTQNLTTVARKSSGLVLKERSSLGFSKHKHDIICGYLVLCSDFNFHDTI